MYVSVVTNFQELYDIESEWNSLARGVPFRTREWLHGWWRHYGRLGQLFTPVVFSEEGELIGALPLYLSRSTRHGSVLRPMGSGEVCSDYLSLLCRPEDEALIVETISDFLCEDAALRWDLLQWDGVDQEDTALLKLIDALELRGHLVHRRESHRCWRVNLPETWEDYLAMLSKSHRKQLRKLDRRVLSTDRTKVHCVQSSEDLEQAWNILVHLHQKRWNELGEPGCFASDPFKAFHHEACYWLLSSKQIRLYWLELDGQPVAAEYQLVGDGVTYCYQSGLDPDYIEENPGQMLTLATIQRAIAEGQQAIDFLRGDEPYKAHWRAEPRQQGDIRIVSRRKSAQVRHNLWLAADNMKQWVKGGMTLIQGET